MYYDLLINAAVSRAMHRLSVSQTHSDGSRPAGGGNATGSSNDPARKHIPVYLTRTRYTNDFGDACTRWSDHGRAEGHTDSRSSSDRWITQGKQTERCMLHVDRKAGAGMHV